MHPKNMTTDELIHEASLCDGHSLMMNEALAYWLGKRLQEKQLQPDQWTVILLYPDYLQDDETVIYRAQVTADTHKAAVYRARMDANDGNPGTQDPHDFALLALFQGWHDDEAYMA